MPLMAIEKLKKKAAWQLYAGANDVPPATANQISKYIDQYEDAVKYADDEDKELIDVEDYIPSEYIDLFRKSNDYQGITINLKVHVDELRDVSLHWRGSSNQRVINVQETLKQNKIILWES